MTTLITGGSGQVGSRFAARMRQWRAPMRLLLRNEEQAAPWWDAGVEVVVGDIRDAETLERAVDGVDAVVHIAAAFRGTGQGVPPEEAFAVNRDGSIALAEAALKHGVRRFVMASTGLVYGQPNR